MRDLYIAVVDDDAPIRDSLEIYLSSEGRRIACFPDGEAFLAAVVSDPPDIVFLDVKMPGLSGLEVLRRLDRPSFPVIMVSAHGDISIAVQAIKLGAADFIEKPFTSQAVDEAVAAAGEKNPASAGAPAQSDPLAALTEREREIALALNEGLTNKEIARKYEISPRTVEVHRARVFEKTGVRNVAGLVRLLAGFDLAQ